MTESGPWENPLVLFLHYDGTLVAAGAMPWRKYLMPVVEGSLQERETEAEGASEAEKASEEREKVADGGWPSCRVRMLSLWPMGAHWPHQMPPTLLELVCPASVKRKECRTSYLHICPFMSTSTVTPSKWGSPFPLVLPYVDISTLFGAMPFACSKSFKHSLKVSLLPLTGSQ